MKKLNNAITDVPGIEIGQAQDDEALTGCTVVLCRKGAVAGVDVRGSAPGTRETDLLDPVNLVEKAQKIPALGVVLGHSQDAIQLIGIEQVEK